MSPCPGENIAADGLDLLAARVHELLEIGCEVGAVGEHDIASVWGVAVETGFEQEQAGVGIEAVAAHTACEEVGLGQEVSLDNCSDPSFGYGRYHLYKSPCY